MKKYAQIDAAGVCFSVVESRVDLSGDDIVDVGFNKKVIGKKWDGSAWKNVDKSAKEKAKEALEKIDKDTGMSRLLRETLIAIGGQSVPKALKDKEDEAAIERGKL